MDDRRGIARDHALARVASWTRRTAVAAVLLCAALAAVFAHALPGHLGAQPGTGGSSTGSTGDGSTGGSHGHGGVQPPASPPGAGSGAGQVTSGAS